MEYDNHHRVRRRLARRIQELHRRRQDNRRQSTHVWSPQSNDFILQLRKRGIEKIMLCGMLANMCVESHLRDLLENGFEVTVVRDATSGPRHPTRGDGYQAALINYAFLAHAVVTTTEVVTAMTATVGTTDA